MVCIAVGVIVCDNGMCFFNATLSNEPMALSVLCVRNWSEGNLPPRRFRNEPDPERHNSGTNPNLPVSLEVSASSLSDISQLQP